jgi:hypothetical protein
LTELSRAKEEEEGKKRKCWRERPAMCVAFLLDAFCPRLHL